jgi:hypothetical protein
MTSSTTSPQVMMTISDWAIVLATFLGPIVAIQIQKFIESRKASNDEKRWIFRTLMATRATVLSPERVQAYNLIDIIFYKDANVLSAWKALFENFKRFGKDQAEEAVIKRARLDTELLHIMAKSLNFDFDKTAFFGRPL